MRANMLENMDVYMGDINICGIMGLVCDGMGWYGMGWNGMVRGWYVMVWDGLGMVWHCMGWYGMVW